MEIPDAEDWTFLHLKVQGLHLTPVLPSSSSDDNNRAFPSVPYSSLRQSTSWRERTLVHVLPQACVLPEWSAASGRDYPALQQVFL